MNKEKLLKRSTAVGATLAIALGASACDNPFTDSNDIPPCPNAWGNNSIGLEYPYDLTMSDATAQLEAGRSILVSRIHEDLGYSNNQVKSIDIPGKYKAAASLLIHQTNEFWYDTSEAELDTPSEQFCNDSFLYKYKSPTYVQAEAALKAAGINTFETSNE